LVTTTPKPIRLLRDLLAVEGHGVVITRDSTLANAANLPPAFIEPVTKRYGGTRLGRQELNAELLEDTPGALWTRAMLEGAAFKEITPIWSGSSWRWTLPERPAPTMATAWGS
jgi:phage terminase large subunit-like protein